MHLISIGLLYSDAKKKEEIVEYIDMHSFKRNNEIRETEKRIICKLQKTLLFRAGIKLPQ